MEDFKNLIEEAHKRGLKVMMDIVYNHTSHDAVLLDEHPEWFFYRNGKNTNRVGDWSDIIDLDYTHRELWDYQLETLEIFTAENIQAAIKAAGKESGAKGKMLFMPCRIATTGQMHGPDLPKALVLLGKETVLNRISQFI